MSLTTVSLILRRVTVIWEMDDCGDEWKVEVRERHDSGLKVAVGSGGRGGGVCQRRAVDWMLDMYKVADSNAKRIILG